MLVRKCAFAVMISSVLVACNESPPQTTNDVFLANQDAVIGAEYLELKENFESLREDYLALNERLKGVTEEYHALKIAHASMISQLEFEQTENLEMGLALDGQHTKEQNLLEQIKEQINTIALLKIENSQLEKKVVSLANSSQISAVIVEESRENIELERTNEQLVTDIQQIQEGLLSVAEEKEQLEVELEISTGTGQLLEQQLADLIELEASAESLSQQLSAGLTNVEWNMPAEIDVLSPFEIIIKASATESFNGLLFVAELLVDPAMELVSAASVEAQVVEGQLQWRWRLKGERQKSNAGVELLIHQEIQYEDDRIMRQLYRDNKTLAVTDETLLEKYGLWLVVVAVGLFAGYLVGQTNPNKKEKNKIS